MGLVPTPLQLVDQLLTPERHEGGEGLRGSRGISFLMTQRVADIPTVNTHLPPFPVFVSLRAVSSVRFPSFLVVGVISPSVHSWYRRREVGGAESE